MQLPLLQCQQTITGTLLQVRIEGVAVNVPAKAMCQEMLQ